MSTPSVLLPLAKNFGQFGSRSFPIGKEFESFADDIGCANTGSGYLFDCAWFDAIFSGIMFGVVLVISQLASERMKIWKKLDDNQRYEWVSSISNWTLSIVSSVGSIYILSINEWYLDHPGNPTNNVNEYTPQLNFFSYVQSQINEHENLSLHSIYIRPKTYSCLKFHQKKTCTLPVPWMIGNNIGRIIHVISGLVRALNDVNLWDTLPHVLHIILYGVVLDQKKFGMIAVFQMLLQSHHLYTVPQVIMEHTKRADNVCYKILDWMGFFIKIAVLVFAGPYCLAILWYHWGQMKQFSFFTQMTYIIVIGLNTLLFTGDIAFGIYWVYCKIVGQDAHKWYKDFLKRDRREKRRIRRAGYRVVGGMRRNANDPQQLADESSDDLDSSDDDVDLGQTTPMTGGQQSEVQLTKRK